MEKRKLQRTGGSSFSLTLPKEWVSRFALTSQDIVHVVPQKTGTLVVSPASLKALSAKTTLMIDGFSKDQLIREFIAVYVAGFDEVTIKAKKFTTDQRAAIRLLPQYLIGFEIIDESSEMMVFKNIFDASKLPIPKSIEKMFTIVQSMFDDALMAVSNHDAGLAKDVQERDFEVDKLHLFLTRQLHSLLQDKISEQHVGLDRLDLYFFQTVALQLERIADHAVKIALVGVLQAKKPEKALVSAYHKVTEKLLMLLRTSGEMVRKLDRKQAHAILDMNPSLEKLIHSQSSDHAKSAVGVLIADSLDRLRGYIMNIAEAVIDQSLARQIWQ